MPLDTPGPVSQALLGKNTGAAIPVASAMTPTTVSQTITPSAAAAPAPPASPIAQPTPDTSNQAPPDVFSSLGDQITAQVNQLQPVQMQMGPAPPPPILQPPPAQPTNSNPGTAWGSTAMLLALTASALTRRPLTSALNAGAQVLQAVKTNTMNSAAAKQQFEVWKTQTANALNLYRYETEQYNDVFKDTNDNSRDQTGRLTALFTAFKDSGAYAAWQQGGTQGLTQFLAKRSASAASLAGQSNRLLIAQLESQSWQEWLGANPQPTDPAEMPAWNQQALVAAKGIFSSSAAASGADNLPILPGAAAPPPGGTTAPPTTDGTQSLPASSAAPNSISGTAAGAAPAPESLNLPLIRQTEPGLYNTAYMMANYDIAPPSSYSELGGNAAKVLSIAQAINPSYSATLYPTITKTREAFSTGVQGNSVRSFNVMISHLNTLGQLAQALQNGDMRYVNQLSNAYSLQTGSPAITNFDAAKQIVGQEVVKAITGSAGALADRETAENQINAATSPEQLIGVIQTFQRLAAGQLNGLRQQYTSNVGVNDFDRFLSPDTMQVLSSLPPAGTPPPPAPYTPAPSSNGGGSIPAAGSTLHYDAQGNLVQ